MHAGAHATVEAFARLILVCVLRPPPRPNVGGGVGVWQLGHTPPNQTGESIRGLGRVSTRISPVIEKSLTRLGS